jgi:hypothetical protein
MPPTRAGSRIAVPSPKIMVCRCAGEQTVEMKQVGRGVSQMQRSILVITMVADA